jgi:hypothetical protein
VACVTGACTGGTCTAAAAASGEPGTLTVHRLAIGSARGHARPVSALGTIDAGGEFDPTIGGAAIELRGPDGKLLVEASAPGGEFRGNESGRFFRYVASPPVEPGAIRRLTFRVRRGAVNVRLRASLPDTIGIRDLDQVSWVVRASDRCMPSAGLVCEASASRMLCR